MQDLVQSLQGAESTFYYVFLSVFRYVAPALAFLILFRAVKPLLFFRRAPEIWAWLTMADGTKLPITHWENVIGRSKSCDVVLDVPTISRNHCVLTRYDDGSWTIRDTESSGGLFINGKRKSIWALQPEDVIEIGGVKMTLQPITSGRRSGWPSSGAEPAALAAASSTCCC